MKGAAWYKHYAADFLNGVDGIGPDTIGCYIVVLDMIYDRGDGIPDDARLIAGRLGCSTRKARILVERLIDLGKLFRTPSGLSNGRAETELTITKLKRYKFIENGAKGGRNRAIKAGRSLDFNGLDKNTFKPGLSIARGLPDKKIESCLSMDDSALGAKNEKQSAVVTPDAALAAAKKDPPNLPAAPPDETIIVTSALLGTRLMRGGR